MPYETKNKLNAIYSIPSEIAIDYPIIISDIMIKKSCRKMGYGRWLAEYIVFDIYKHENISLNADGDGKYFWPKMGFESVQNQKHIMILNRINTVIRCSLQ